MGLQPLSTMASLTRWGGTSFDISPRLSAGRLARALLPLEGVTTKGRGVAALYGAGGYLPLPLLGMPLLPLEEGTT